MVSDLSRQRLRAWTWRRCRISGRSAHTMARRDHVPWFSHAPDEHEERVSRVSPRTGVPRSRSAIARRRTRLLAIGALGVVLVALAWLVLGSGGSREYRVIMQNAGQLVPGDIVRIGGV